MLVWGRAPSPVQAEQSSAAHLGRDQPGLPLHQHPDGCPTFALFAKVGTRSPVTSFSLRS